MTTHRKPRHRKDGRASGPLHAVRAAEKASALGLVSLTGAGLLGLVPAPEPTTAKFVDASAAQVAVSSTRWATAICVIQSNESRPEVGFTIGSHALLGNRGWTSVVDKTAATTVAQLAGCDVVMIAGEAWGVKAASRTLALAWMAAGGSVLSTGNDTGDETYPLPELITTIGEAVPNFPYGGAVPAPAATRARVSPAYPTWTPDATYGLDSGARPVTAVASGAVCVATVNGHPEWCAAIARTNPAGGRWVHLHTKVGSATSLGEVAGADAALAWLAIERS